MDFEITLDDIADVNNAEISALLTQVYVDGGFTEPEEAAQLFEPSAVRKRGTLIVAREVQHLQLVGMVIIVPPDSPARRLAQENEAELHLLGVKSEYRYNGLGRKLVEFAINRAKQSNYSKLVLWTQISMQAAQALYESAGFKHVNDMHRNGRDFKVYEMMLDIKN